MCAVSGEYGFREKALGRAKFNRQVPYDISILQKTFVVDEANDHFRERIVENSVRDKNSVPFHYSGRWRSLS